MGAVGKMMRNRIWIIIGMSVIVVCGTVLYLRNEPRVYEVDQPITADPNDCQDDLRFAVIGDFGDAGQAEAEVAALVGGWDVDLVITTGDNNYPDGQASTIDLNIGQYYSDYIYPYKGGYGSGGTENRFFPTLGNHDWRDETLQPYYDYFTLPGNERYYDFESGPVHFFILDSDEHEPDGISQDSIQADWFEQTIAASRAPWNLVFLHRPPFGSSSNYGSNEEIQWPFSEWGADAVFSGHAHLYERLVFEGIPYFVNGLGGRWKTVLAIHRFGDVSEHSLVRYNRDYGAQLVTVDQTCINFTFYSRSGDLVDSYTRFKQND
jgi:hypothetical protein